MADRGDAQLPCGGAQSGLGELAVQGGDQGDGGAVQAVGGERRVGGAEQFGGVGAAPQAESEHHPGSG